MSWISGCALGFAVVVVAVNLVYSALSAWVHHLREGHWPRSFPLGIPLVGTLAVLFAVGFGDGLWHPYLIATLIVFDTGGPLAATLNALQQRLHQQRNGRRIAVEHAIHERQSTP